MKKLSESLRQHAMDLINFEKKRMIPLTKQLWELPENSKICYICKKTLYKSTTIVKLETIVIM